eukprot:SAG11_NODE_1304_length_5250_cov_5.457581_3_plen_143_part_00
MTRLQRRRFKGHTSNQERAEPDSYALLLCSRCRLAQRRQLAEYCSKLVEIVEDKLLAKLQAKHRPKDWKTLLCSKWTSVRCCWLHEGAQELASVSAANVLNFRISIMLRSSPPVSSFVGAGMLQAIDPGSARGYGSQRVRQT